jgi:hypothetical protein
MKNILTAAILTIALVAVGACNPTPAPPPVPTPVPTAVPCVPNGTITAVGGASGPTCFDSCNTQVPCPTSVKKAHKK